MNISIMYIFVLSDIPAPVVLVRRTKNTQLRLTGLLDEHIYNVSVAAATAAGYGEVVFISITTCKYIHLLSTMQ